MQEKIKRKLKINFLNLVIKLQKTLKLSKKTEKKMLRPKRKPKKPLKI